MAYAQQPRAENTSGSSNSSKAPQEKPSHSHDACSADSVGMGISPRFVEERRAVTWAAALRPPIKTSVNHGKADTRLTSSGAPKLRPKMAGHRLAGAKQRQRRAECLPQRKLSCGRVQGRFDQVLRTFSSTCTSAPTACWQATRSAAVTTVCQLVQRSRCCKHVEHFQFLVHARRTRLKRTRKRSSCARAVENVPSDRAGFAMPMTKRMDAQSMRGAVDR